MIEPMHGLSEREIMSPMGSWYHPLAAGNVLQEKCPSNTISLARVRYAYIAAPAGTLPVPHKGY